MSFSLGKPDSVIQGCFIGSAETINKWQKYTTNFQKLSYTIEKLAVGRSQPPSVYDVFMRAAQFFVTTALLS
ncbi:3353_t:CDS:2 [Diversispora eburnea]|uniref:3353_t:CDS:1 n=1 Tax=Diversispora eburnea TaxID=1213867 RepID=A0A9N9GHV3_9GLOM|nr:3353_t:CDS:2 [Diversispora eburnea]